MRSLIAFLCLSQILSGCATMSYSCQEACALRNMVCQGTNLSEGSGTAYNSMTNQMAIANYGGESYSCRVPLSDEDRKTIQVYQPLAQEKAESNSKAERNTLLAIFIPLGALLIGIAVSALSSNTTPSTYTVSAPHR